MDLKKLSIAAAVLALLAGGLWYSNQQEALKKDKPAASPDDAPKMLEIPQDQIAKIEIRRMGAEPVLLEKGAVWAIKAPKALGADQEAVSSLVGTLAVLSSDRLVEEKAGDLAPFGLKTPILTLVVSRKDGKTHTLQIGDAAPAGSSTYAKVEGDARLFTIPSFTKAALEKTWQELQDKRLLTFDAEKLNRVVLTPAKGGAIEFGKNNANGWTILAPKAYRADNFATEELVRKLKDAKMEVSNDSEEVASWPAKFTAGTPVAVAKVTDQSGTQQIEVRKGKEKDYYAKSSAREGVFKTTAELGEGMGKELADFRSKKLFDFGFNTPERVEVKSEGKSFVFAKSGSDWKREGKTIDPGSVQQLVDKLRDLTAAKFADGAFGTGAAEYILTLPQGKGTEQVTVSKRGEVYVARRGTEPELLELDGKVVGEIRELAESAKEVVVPAPAAPAAKKK